MVSVRDELLLHLAWWRRALGPRLLGPRLLGPRLLGPRLLGPKAPAAAGAAAGRGVGAENEAVLAALAEEVAACRRCGLCEGRTRTVFGEGPARPRLVVIGEAPGAEEDRTGRPFVGRAGQLLTKMLAAIGLDRERDVYILNVLKCRPPGNRDPRPDEVAACRPYLQAQLEALGLGSRDGDAPEARPPLLLLLGSAAARLVLATEQGITRLRGRFHVTPEGWRALPTFHPAYLLRNPGAKRDAWHDLQQAAKDLGLQLPAR